ncbi:YerC/YecD family TrpR-related protein [Luteimonas sp. e5]
MKTRRPRSRQPRFERDVQALAHAIASLQDADTIVDFLYDLCTPAELEAMADRWKVVPRIAEGMPYREIHEATGVSVTTVGRVARTLNSGTGGYAAALRAQADAS